MKDEEVILYMDLFLSAQKAQMQGSIEAAEFFAAQAVAMAPKLPAAHQLLGAIKLGKGDWKAAVPAMHGSYLLRRGPRAAFTKDTERRRTPAFITLPKLMHDLEQIEYLMAKGVRLKITQSKLRSLKRLVQESIADGLKGGSISVSLATRQIIKEFYGKAIHLYLPEPIKGGALNPKLRFRDIEKTYLGNGRGVVYFDDFLKPQALEQVRAFCLESTFWHNVKLDGYLMATLYDGFSCGLLHQIAAELQEKLPKIYGDNSLSMAWSVKCDSKMPGTPLHADEASVNSNFWITPDSARLSAKGGGIIVWPCKPPQSWSFRDYNSVEPKPEKKRLEMLGKSKVSPIYVPYRQNRMVIFDSKFLHKTDKFQFKEGYENRRMNVTLLHSENIGRVE